jgi:hypothetical protein
MKWNRPPFITLATIPLILTLVALQPIYGGDKASTDATHPAGKDPMTHLYGNHECPVSGEAVVPDASVTYNDKEHGVYGRIYLCCIGCEKKVKKNISEVYKTLYRTDKKTGKPMEPKDLKNEKCPMSGEPVDAKALIEYNGMIVHFCCPGCAQGFLKNPEAKMAVLLPDAKEFEFQAKPGSHSSM